MNGMEHRLEFLDHGPKDSLHRIVLAHGAGAPMDSPFLDSMSKHLVNKGFRVVRFEFPYMRLRRSGGSKRPPDALPVLMNHWRQVMEHLGNPETWIVGGKSMGGRIASLVADQLSVKGLVCLGYPLHPPGRPDKLRADHLVQLNTPMLIVQGERDPFGTASEFRALSLSPNIMWRWLPDGDHSLKPGKRSGFDYDEHLAKAATEIYSFAVGLTS